MTQEQIDFAERLLDAKEEARRIYDKTISHLEEQLKHFAEICDHQRPDGTSAIRKPYLFSTCEYCGKSERSIRSERE